ncbi:chymotrypsinogen B2-like [Clytia hemisphaerica]|uniref:Peptidase S1 domain-containing protein n=1 Tax=Clytia hemisphaerica TaxID=252671 RepID=A0A7M5X5V4_9CNID
MATTDNFEGIDPALIRQEQALEEYGLIDRVRLSEPLSGEDPSTATKSNNFFYTSSLKGDGRRTTIVCVIFVLLFVGWTGYTLCEVILQPAENGKKTAEQHHDHISKYSHPVCGKIQCAGDCSEKKRSRRVVSGADVRHGDWPWMAGLTLDKKFRCGGVLVNELHVLTSAHCLYRRGEKLDSNQIQIFLGSVHRSEEKLEPSKVRLAVKDLIIHKQFDPKTLENDIALVKLTDDVTFSKSIQPVCLPKYSADAPGYMLGWGKFKPDGPLSPKLQQVKMPLVTNQQCQKQNNKIFRRVKVHSENHICIGHGAQSPEYACAGDSGSGFFQQKKGMWFLQGLVSWIDPSCNSTLHNTYTVLTNVAKYENWIGENIHL